MHGSLVLDEKWILDCAMRMDVDFTEANNQTDQVRVVRVSAHYIPSTANAMKINFNAVVRRCGGKCDNRSTCSSCIISG